jgi:LPS O-antigen subunit length determinant protein (WzzB/FepE family)
MQKDTQELHDFQENEIDLIALFNSLVARKFLILGLTAFITLLSVIYSHNLTSIYKVTSTFTSPDISSIYYISTIESKINGTEKEKKSFDEIKKSIFSDYLTSLSSREFQKKVFIEGDFLTLLNPNNNPINDVNSFASGYISSIALSPPNVTAKDFSLGFLTELPYSISMVGSNSEFISRYLNELVEAANTHIVSQFTNLVELKINNRLDQISKERQWKLINAKQTRHNEIEVLLYASELAKTLGIKENNFKLLSEDAIDFNFTNPKLPQWYLYGERALNERIKLLKARSNDEPFIQGLLELDTIKTKLESIVIDSSRFNAMSISQSSIVPTTPIGPNKKRIVLMAFIGGFLMSIFLALFMNLFKPDELTPPV